MEGMRDLREIVDKVKEVDSGVNNLIVPLLKDTIQDSNKHNRRLFVSNAFLTTVVLAVAIIAMMIVAYQNNKYAEFLSQYDVSETIYQETTDNSSINSGINITKYK